jgi:hypothetical protein
LTAAGVNLLVLLLGDTPPRRLRDAIAARTAPPARIHVVAPAIVGPLDWLATAEDTAYQQAEVRAFEAEWTLADQAQAEGEAGDVDPIQAVEDALRGFPADEILIAGEAADSDLEQALRRFDLPVRRLDRAPRSGHSRLYRALRGLAGGHGNATPFLLFLGVNTALLLLGVLLSLLALLILWLSGNL